MAEMAAKEKLKLAAQEAKKKAVEEKKKQKEAERERAKQEDATRRNISMMCGKALSKMAGLQAKLEKSFKDDLLSQVPHHVKSEAEKSLEKVKQIMEVAKDHADGSPMQQEKQSVMNGLDEVWHEGDANHKQLSAFLITCAKNRKAL